MLVWRFYILNDNLEKNSIVLLQQVYEELLLDKNKIEKTILENSNKIKEIEIYLESLFEKEDVDYEVFSPRNIQYICRDKIENQKKDKEKLIRDNFVLNNKIVILSSRIEKLYTVLIRANGFFKKTDLEEKKYNDFFNDNDNILNNKNDDDQSNTSYDNISELNDISEVEEKCDDIKLMILDIQEKERKRIARDLHDNTVQNLTHLIHKIELSSKFIDQDVIRAKMELLDVNRNIKSIINDMRNIIFYLRPMEFDDIGLKATFDKYFNEVQFQTTIQLLYNIEDIVINNQLVAISIFHIVKECVNNAIKHSKASCLNVDIKEKNSNISIIVNDDGIGFEFSKTNNKRHFGLALLKENVSILKGKIDIKSIINKGTIITICIPNCKVKGVLND